MNKKEIVWEAEYVGSFVSLDTLPKRTLPGIAVIGRSNVGKSSFINALCAQKGLARVSANPGKTQTLNFYEINRKFYLVDMPGYGYAKVSKDRRGEWSELSSKFLSTYEHLMCTMILIDANIEFQNVDQQFISWCGHNQIPFMIIRTKCDKSKPGEIDSLQREFENSLKESWEELPLIFRHSAVKRTGNEEIKNEIKKIITSYSQH